jgi:hypothetical protein
MKVWILIALFLFACGPSKEQKEMALQESGRETTACANNNTTYFDYAVCMNVMAEKYFRAVDFPYPEVISLSNSYHLALAERVDAGELTPQQALQIWMQLRRELIGQASAARRAEAQRASEWRQLIWALNTNYAIRTPINCMQTGAFITCN